MDYFDFYLMHAQNAESFCFFKKHRAYETVLKLKAEGKVRRLGISLHDRAEVLEQILIEYPQVEEVQIQFNYVDYDNPTVESYGSFQKSGQWQPCQLRYSLCCRFGGVMMVLSGMSSLEQMDENISFMKAFQPLNRKKTEAVEKVRDILRSMTMIPCTFCHYCTVGCPQKIAIPDLFIAMNNKSLFQDTNEDFFYHEVYTKQGGKGSDCIRCGKSEKACPQHLHIRDLLFDVAKKFEK